MRARFRRLSKIAAIAVVATLTLTACAAVVDGDPSVENAPNANLNVRGVDDDSKFDTVAQNALADVESFWKVEFPKVSGGKSLPPIKGGLYSVDGLKVAQTRSASGQAVESNGCAKRTISALIDNAFFCRIDDSIVWDRADTHLFAKLAEKYGDFTVALIFAHEFGHAVQDRLGIFDDDPKTIFTESQADCAAGAWAKGVVDQRAPHFRDITLAKVDDALEGFLNGRDSTPENLDEISHGNGFDRLSAVADGFDKGVSYCYSKGYFESRTFTERPYNSDEDEASGGNLPLAQVVDTTSTNILVTDLNRFWTSAAQGIKKTFKPVKIAQADHPRCGQTSADFGYCPDDNTVYFSSAFATKAYNSLPDIQVDRSTGDVTLLSNQPADFALGTMFSIGWGFAVRHQLFDRELDSGAALKSGVCYTGAYAKSVNVENPAGRFLLSPADLDEGVAALLDEVPQDSAFGARDTTGLDRIQSFIKGYKGGLTAC